MNYITIESPTVGTKPDLLARSSVVSFLSAPVNCDSCCGMYWELIFHWKSPTVGTKPDLLARSSVVSFLSASVNCDSCCWDVLGIVSLTGNRLYRYATFNRYFDF